MNDTNKKLPQRCPSCEALLEIKRMRCKVCGTEVDGVYDLPLLLRINREDQSFILNFLKFSGSLKEMAKLLNLSYPTVRNRLDDIIEKIKNIENETISDQSV